MRAKNDHLNACAPETSKGERGLHRWRTYRQPLLRNERTGKKRRRKPSAGYAKRNKRKVVCAVEIAKKRECVAGALCLEACKIYRGGKRTRNARQDKDLHNGGKKSL